MCDLTRKHTLLEMTQYVDKLRRFKEGMDCPCILIGNKIDIASDSVSRQITNKDMITFTNIWLNRCPILETSTTNGKYMEEALSILLTQMRSAIHPQAHRDSPRENTRNKVYSRTSFNK